MRHLIAIFLVAVLPFALFAQKNPAWKLYYDSAQLYWGKDWPKTIPLLTRAERSALSDLGIYDENYLTIINDLGLAYSHVNDYANAERLLANVLKIKIELNSVHDAEYFRSVSNLAGVRADRGNYKQATKSYRSILSGYSTPSSLDPALYWSSVRSLVRLYETQDLLDSALLALDDVKKKTLSSEPENRVGRYEVDLARGRIYRKLKKYDEATPILETIVNDLKDQQDQNLFFLYVGGLQETGLLYAETGLYDKAEKNLLQGFRLLKSKQPVSNSLLTEVLNSLGSVYEKLGIYDKATVYYQDALEVSKREFGEIALSSLTLQSNLAGIYLTEGNPAEAITRYEAIVKVLETNTLPSGVFFPTVLNNLATAHRKNNNYQKASEYLMKAASLAQTQKLDKTDLAATILNNQAVLLTTLGQLDQSLPFYEKAYALKQEIYGENSVLLMDLASNMAVVYWALQKTDQAIPLFKKSIALAVRQINYIFPNLSENEQVQFYQRLKEDFERFSTIAIQLNKPELLTQAFNNQVVIKSLLFFTQEHRRAQIAAKNDSVLNRQFELLHAKREQLGLFYQLSLREQASAETTAAKLEKEIDALEKTISLKTSETVAEKMMEQRVQWNDLQSRIKPDEAVIELLRLRKYDLKTYVEQSADRVQFGFTDSVYYAALITTTETKQYPKLILLKKGLDMETRFLSYYRNALTFNVRDENSYSGYWKPLEASVSNKSKIYFSGDGVYHRLNLNTLIHPESGQFLIQRFEIRYLLNPGQLLQEQESSFTSRKATLFGDPAFDLANKQPAGTSAFASLPGTNKEVAEVNKILKGNSWATTQFLKEQASEKNFKSLNSPGILHVATHGFFSAEKVNLTAEAKKDFLFYSGLALAGANRNLQQETQEIFDDGILTAYEVMNLNLSSTHLVVLSACETGLGKIENGEGVYGLQRSFLQAGARNILISLWKVDDTITQQLMVKFYQNLIKQHSVRGALRQAQLDQLKETRDPASWGGFIAIGLD